VGLCISWKLSIAFIFRSVKDKEKASSPKAFFLFAFIGVMGLVLTELGMLIMVHTLPAILLFGRTKCLDLPWAEWLAKIVMTFIVMVFNYLGRKLFIFKS
jgi:putative flippase GtrA